ncbi:uncharacterized protein LOC123551431 isoform X3 [Mercenaria mercenaria]|uniref:uncharacterized protein LOC123551431 isoform X3 n=1 Tax=Mercenaria mercenaria TaxID=6596 RepID=UPI001E1D4BBB|nr:uncharacterized protein LOC123551431 isoform X3 [Mercenaria mercenaria]
MDVKTIKLGTREVEFPSDKLQPLEACNHLLGDRDALWKELNEKGYLYVKGLHDRNEVLEARRSVLQYILSEGDGKLDLKKNWEEGVLDLRCGGGCLPYMEGRNDITHSEAVSKILEGPRPFAFFKTLFGETVRTFDYKWLRFDKLHSTYSQVDVEDINLNGSGWFTTDPFDITYQFGGQWKTTKYEAGDVLIFGMNTVHMSTANLTDLVRISCDTRWQPASEPADPRYVGDFKPTAKFGLYASVGSKPRTVTMEELKAKWGFQ